MTTELTYEIYSPTSVLGIFNNALRLPTTVSLIFLKGRYAFGGGKAYSNYYYDLLYSENDSTSISVKISSLLRSKIQNNDIYTLKGFVEKSVKNSSIQLVFVVDEIIQQEQKQISEEDLQRYELIQEKLTYGSVDLETLIREKALKNQKIKIANIYGHNAIVQKDFAEGLDISQKFFEITNFTCNITSATSILTQLNELKAESFDIIALVRGGGDRQSFDVFNEVKLAKEFISLNALSITALGHTVDESLLDKLADKRFHVPYDYGAGLHSIIEKLNEEKSNSRAILIEEVKKDVTKQFTEQVKTLEEQLKKKNDEFVNAQKTFKENVEEQTKTFNEQLKVRNEEVEKLKKDLSEQHGEQIKTLTDQLTKKNEEFQKLQDTSTKQLRDLQDNFSKQQKNRQEELENYKKEIASLHEKNIQSAVQSQTASLSAKVEMVSKENEKLQEELNKKNSNFVAYFIIAIVGIVVGFIISRLN